MQTFYDALEVGIGCDATDIRDAYKRLALTFHPDKTGSTSVDAGDRFRLINEVPSLV
jgi:DnaJ-class molecular chaperone